jgi:cytochrome c oxidase subunit 4
MADHHGPSLNTYVAIFVALLTLTGLTVAVAYVDLGAINAPLAVVIAMVKATLVILFFMHVKYETKLVGLYAASGFIFVAILIVMTMGEVAGRREQPRDVLGPPNANAQPAPTTTPSAAH